MLKAFQIALIAFAATVTTPIDQSNAATYAFNATSVVTPDPFAPSPSSSTFPAVSISIQDSAVQSGSFSAAYVGSPANFLGDYASLISFNIGNVGAVTPTVGDASTFRASLLFNTDGSVSAGTFFYDSASFNIVLAGTNALFQGVFTSTDTSGQGFVSGTLTAVPEPTSLILLAGGILGLGYTRQRFH